MKNLEKQREPGLEMRIFMLISFVFQVFLK